MREYLPDIVKCVRCGRCRTLCPAQEVLRWESSGPRGRMQLAHGLTAGLEPSQGLVDNLLGCTTCHLCVQECPAGADPLVVTQAARRKLVGLGRMTFHQKTMMDRIDSTGNSLGDRSPRRSWLMEQDVPIGSGHVYFAGCLASYRQQATAASTYEILKGFGVGLLEDERCCGSPLVRLGLDPEGSISHNIQQLHKAGAHTVIAGCAGCYSMLREHYEGINVLHVSEFLADRLDELKIGGLDITVTYHDPCHLGRSYGIYEAPRRVINAICALTEMKSTKEQAHCCGGGGGVRSGYPELSASIADNLVNNIPHGVDYVVTACPMCFRNLSDKGLKILDLAELVWMSTG